MTLALLGVGLSASVHAASLVTFPTPARGSIAYAPAPLATADIDWLTIFAANGPHADDRLSDFRLSGLLSATPMAAGSMLADYALNALTWNFAPPAHDPAPQQ